MLQPKKYYVWIDCDPGFDDVLAIILAARNQQIELVGVSTSAGNTSIQNTTQNALDALFSIQRSDVPVISGSSILVQGEPKYLPATDEHGGIGGVNLLKSDKKAIKQNSFQVISDIIMKCPQKIIWANTGALTNLCFLLRKHPQVKTKIDKIVMMGGAIGKGNSTPAAQFNVYFDPYAFKEVLISKQHIPLVMIPLELTHQVLAKEGIFNFLKQRNQVPILKIMLQLFKQFQANYKQWQDFDYPPMHDPTVINYILNPDDFEIKKAHIEVDTYELSYGRTNCFFKSPVPGQKLQSIDYVALKMNNRKKFWQLYQKMFEELRQDYYNTNNKHYVK